MTLRRDITVWLDVMCSMNQWSVSSYSHPLHDVFIDEYYRRQHSLSLRDYCTVDVAHLMADQY